MVYKKCTIRFDFLALLKKSRTLLQYSSILHQLVAATVLCYGETERTQTCAALLEIKCTGLVNPFFSLLNLFNCRRSDGPMHI